MSRISGFRQSHLGKATVGSGEATYGLGYSILCVISLLGWSLFSFITFCNTIWGGNYQIYLIFSQHIPYTLLYTIHTIQYTSVYHTHHTAYYTIHITISIIGEVIIKYTVFNIHQYILLSTGDTGRP